MTPEKTLTRREVINSYILSPAEAFDARREADDWERNAPKLYWCNETLGRVLSPMLMGEFVGMMGYTGNGKTAVALAQAYFEARKLLRDGMDTKSSVAYYTWDQPAETLEKKIEKMLLRDLKLMPEQYKRIHRMQLPLWWGGKNKRNQRRTNYRVPPLTLELIDEVLDEICGAEKKPALVVVDYVQRIPLQRESERADMVLRVAEKLADFASRRDVTMIMTIQAARAVMNRQNKIPMIHEAQWSSGIEQSCDKLIALWRPATTEKEGTPITIDNQTYTVSQELMTGCVWKDREGMTNREFAFSYDMARSMIGDYQ